MGRPGRATSADGAMSLDRDAVLLPVAIALVSVAAVALVIGLVSNQLSPVYVAMGCSLVALVVLARFPRLGRGRRSGS
jgi:hypothetical protein